MTKKKTGTRKKSTSKKKKVVAVSVVKKAAGNSTALAVPFDMSKLPAGVTKKDVITMMVSDHEEKIRTELDETYARLSELRDSTWKADELITKKVQDFINKDPVDPKLEAALQVFKDANLDLGTKFGAHRPNHDCHKYTISYSLRLVGKGSNRTTYYFEGEKGRVTRKMPDSIKKIVVQLGKDREELSGLEERHNSLAVEISQIQRNERKFIAAITKMALSQEANGQDLLANVTEALASMSKTK